MQRYAVSCSYVGSRFRGWAAQPSNQNIETVCEAVNRALDALVGPGNHGGAVVSSRTDAGVHALWNTFHVDVERRSRRQRFAGANVAAPPPPLLLPPPSPTVLEAAPAPSPSPSSGPYRASELVGGLNAHLGLLGFGRDVAVLAAAAVGPAFHARFSAKRREYVYRIAPCSVTSSLRSAQCSGDDGLGVAIAAAFTPGGGGYRGFAGATWQQQRHLLQLQREGRSFDSSCFVAPGPAMPLFEQDRAWCVVTGDHRCPGGGGGSGGLVIGGLDLAAMRLAAAHMVGTHDFTSLRGPDCAAASPVLTIDAITVDAAALDPPAAASAAAPDAAVKATRDAAASSAAGGGMRCRHGGDGGEGSLDDPHSPPPPPPQQHPWFPLPRAGAHGALAGTPLVTVTVRAPRFLHRLVRNVAGVLVACGRGALAPEDVPALLAARNRTKGPPCAPPHGLFLANVEY